MVTDLFGRAVPPECRFASVLLRTFDLCCIHPDAMEGCARRIVMALRTGDILALARTPEGWSYVVCQHSAFDPSDHFEMRTFDIGSYAGQLDASAVLQEICRGAQSSVRRRRFGLARRSEKSPSPC